MRRIHENYEKIISKPSNNFRVELMAIYLEVLIGMEIIGP